jgi:hypothetical protein
VPGVGRGASMSCILPDLPGVTAIAFRKLSYPWKQVSNETPLRFPQCLLRQFFDDLRNLLETSQSHLDDIYQLHSEILSSQLPIFERCNLLGERIVSQHL